MSRYNFYKYYKSCDLSCDLVIELDPTSGSGSVLSVLINYDNPVDINANMTKLPTW